MAPPRRTLSQPTVDAPTGAVLAMAEERRLPRALMGGTKAMRAETSRYLPQESAESPAAYGIRLNRTFLFNGFAKTVRDMAGKVFAKPIAIGDDVPPVLASYAENIDLEGRNLDVFAHDVFRDALVDGIEYILVEMDPAKVNEAGEPLKLTKAEADDLNRRPWFVHIKAADVIGWRSATENGIEKLTQFRFFEHVTEDDGEFGETDIEQVRVFSREGELVTWQIWRRQVGAGPAGWSKHGSGGRITITEIPICPVYISRTGFMQGLPPLSDLAEKNLEHWQSSSDQRNILHVARVPILFGSGWTPSSPLEIGAARMLTSSDANAKLAYVEHSGAAIGSGRDDLKDLEMQMQALGLELLMPKPGGATATGEAIDQAKMHSTLAMMANALKDALEQAYGFMALYAGLSRDMGGGSLTVNTDYGVSLRGVEDVTSILTAMKDGLISRETGIRELKRRGFLADDIDEAEEVRAALDDSVPLDDADEADDLAALGRLAVVGGRGAAP